MTPSDQLTLVVVGLLVALGLAVSPALAEASAAPTVLVLAPGASPGVREEAAAALAARAAAPAVVLLATPSPTVVPSVDAARELPSPGASAAPGGARRAATGALAGSAAGGSAGALAGSAAGAPARPAVLSRAVLALAARLPAPPVVLTAGLPEGVVRGLLPGDTRVARVVDVGALGPDVVPTLRPALAPGRVVAAAPLVAAAGASGHSPAPLALLALLLGGAAVALTRRARRPRALAGRVAVWTVGAVQPTEPEGVEEDARAAGGPAWVARLDETLSLAGVVVPARGLVLRAAGATALLALLAFVVLPPLAVVPLVAVPLGVRGWVAQRIRRRRARFAEQLGDAVQALASAMRAGHGLSSGLAMLVDELPQPAQDELRTLVAAEQLGVPFDEALGQVVARTANRDLEQVALVAALQREAGGNGAEALDRVVETIRARDEVRRLVVTLTAQGRVSRWVLTGLPVALVAVLLVTGGDYLAPMWQQAAGLVMVGGAAVLLAIGSVWIANATRVEV